MTTGGGQQEGAIERSAYDSAYPRVANALTLYAWRVPAFEVVRAAVAMGVTAVTVTMVEAVLSALTFALFWNAQYWPGVIAGFATTFVSLVALMLERTAPGHPTWAKRARLAVELAPPAFWWWA